MEKIKIYIVDDNIEWTKVMTLFLNSFEDLSVVCNSFDKDTSIEIAKKIDFDVILMDISLNGNHVAGIEAAQEILAHMDTHIIMLTSHHEENIILDSFHAGVVEYVNKDDYESLPYIIRRTFRKSNPNNVLIKELKSYRITSQLEKLTEVEKEVLRLAEKGYTRANIVKYLQRSENTVKKQIGNILKKLEVSTIKEAVKKVTG